MSDHLTHEHERCRRVVEWPGGALTDLACGKVCCRCNYLVNKVTGVRHGDFCSCISGYRNPRIWILALQRQAPPLFLPSYSRKIKWGTALYCLNGFNFHILYLPRTELKPGSDFYIPLQDNAGSRCDDLPCRLFPQMGGWIRPRSTYGRPHLIRHFVCQSPPLLHRFHATQLLVILS